MMSIDYQKDYTLDEVVKDNLIQWVRSYQTLYNMVTDYDEKWKRKCQEVTNESKIKSISVGRLGAKKIEKMFINWKEISNFLNLHNIQHSFTL